MVIINQPCTKEKKKKKPITNKKSVEISEELGV